MADEIKFGRVTVEVLDTVDSFVPTGTKYSVDKTNEPLLEALALSLKANLPALLIGPTGCGKTAGVRLLAEKTKRGYRRVQLTGSTEVSDLIGRWTIKNQETVWVDGPLTDAMRKGHMLVLDEMNMALPEVLAKLNAVLDDDKMLVLDEKDGEVVHAHKDFRVFGTQNPSDEYTGTKDMNLALIDRFAIVLNVTYPSKAQELDIIFQHTGMTADYAMGLTESKTGIPARMVEFAEKVRVMHNESKMVANVSTRQLITWAKLTNEFGVKYAAEIALFSKVSKEEKVKLSSEIDKLFSKEEDAPRTTIEKKLKEKNEKRKTLDEMKAELEKNKNRREGKVVDVEVQEAGIQEPKVIDVSVDSDNNNTQAPF